MAQGGGLRGSGGSERASAYRGGACMRGKGQLARRTAGERRTTETAGHTSGHLPHASLVAVGGASPSFHVAGMHGQIVTVQVPSQALADVHCSTKAQGTVWATVVSVASTTHHVNVRTHEGQKLVLELSSGFLKEMRIRA